MGQGPALLLVTMRSNIWALLLLALSALSACQRQPDADIVAAAGHDAFYVWPGVRPAKTLQPKTLYLLDGEVRRGGTARLERLRMGVPRLPGKTVWLVVRADRLDWTDATYAAIFNDLRQWQAAGNHVAGLQIDFDAATRGIDGYVRFLRDLRQRLPRNQQLSITGLMDWSAHGDPRDLAQLSQIIDEVVVQTYQGRTTIEGYDAYFQRMQDFSIPFRVALVEGGTWRAPAMLAHHPQFRGYVVFLLAAAR